MASMKSRFRFRGLTPLGIFNTVLALLFNKVLVIAYHEGEFLEWWVERADHYDTRAPWYTPEGKGKL